MFKKIMNALSIVLLVVVVLVVLFFFTTRISGNTPSLFGYYIFRVSSDSMEPALSVGDVILVKSAEAEEIQKGDIVTYKSRDGSMYGREVTHRVVTEPVEKKGTYYFQTQGDAAGAPLDKEISYDQIEGKYVRKLPIIGAFFNFLSTQTGIAVFILVIAVVFGYELIALLVSYKKLDEADDKLFGLNAGETPDTGGKPGKSKKENKKEKNKEKKK